MYECTNFFIFARTGCRVRRRLHWTEGIARRECTKIIDPRWFGEMYECTNFFPECVRFGVMYGCISPWRSDALCEAVLRENQRNSSRMYEIIFENPMYGIMFTAVQLMHEIIIPDAFLSTKLYLSRQFVNPDLRNAWPWHLVQFTAPRFTSLHWTSLRR